MAAAAGLALLAGACGARVHHPLALPPPPPAESTTTVTPPTATTVPPTSVAGRVRTAGASVATLAAYPSCSALLSALRAQADAEVQPWGLPQPWGGPARFGVAMPAAPGAASAGPVADASAGGAAAGASNVPAFSGTNDQEAGVDEPDVVKTDGRLLVVLRGTTLAVVDVSGAAPRQVSTVTVPAQAMARGLFLVGEDVVVIGTSYATVPQTTVWVVSLAQPAAPVVSRTFSVDGSYVDARLVGTSVKLIVSWWPQLPLPGGSISANRAAIDRAPLTDWLPAITDAGGQRQPAPCDLVAHDAQSEGVGMTSVVTFDPAASEPGPPITIVGNPGVIYASATNLYVATASYAIQQALASGQPVAGEQTVIHDFDITNATRASYVGSGVVPGVLLNQYALSEYAGALRAATTTGVPTPPPGEGVAPPPADGSQSIVTVLQPRSGALVAVGQLTGLGHGERIYGVRFVGPAGYVVTYRQLDPVFIVDLADPARPALRGSIDDLTGYSAYLHPISADRLLGIGAAADANAHRTGLQVSLFDVSGHTLVAKDVIADGWSEVENDPHAFLWWAPSSLAVVPASADGFDGFVAYRVTPGGLAEAGRLGHQATASGSVRGGPGMGGPAMDGPAMPPMVASMFHRAVVVGQTLYTVTADGVAADDLTTLHERAWLGF